MGKMRCGMVFAPPTQFRGEELQFRTHEVMDPVRPDCRFVVKLQLESAEELCFWGAGGAEAAVLWGVAARGCEVRRTWVPSRRVSV